MTIEMNRRTFFKGLATVLVAAGISTTPEKLEALDTDKFINFAQANVFEINDEFTRSQYRGAVNSYLSTLKNKGLIYDYVIVCDETNNTPEVIDKNEFVSDVYLKPNRSTNFVVYNSRVTRTSVEFKQIIGELKSDIENV